MASERKTVVFGFLGTIKDQAHASEQSRWRWRPTLSLCRHPDLPIDRLELLHDNHSQTLAESICTDIAEVSPATDVRRVTMNLHNPWDFEEVYGALYDFARSYPFDPDREDYLLHMTTGTHVVQICWFLMAESHVIPARLIQTSPPKRSQDSSIGHYEIIDLDLSRYNAIAARFQREQDDTVSFLKAGIATRNVHFNEMIAEVERVSIRSQAPILLCGPTGAGKSFLAERIYDLKRVRHQVSGRFVAINCATLRGDSAMSTLFGHVRGAFTGAQTDRTGLLRSAHNGMVFLDEIAELGDDEQAMLLKAIEEKRFFPFGSDREVESQFQLIAGTCQNLSKRVRDGRFREDLYARINLWSYQLPGLRDRPEDIEPNLAFEVEKFAQTSGNQIRFTVEARDAYLAFATHPSACWNGNFRELSASVTRMATLAQNGRITLPVVEHEIARLRRDWFCGDDSAGILTTLGIGNVEEIDLFDRMQLESVVQVCRRSGSLSDAGRTLFAVSRQSRKSTNDADRLRKYLSRFGLDWNDVQSMKN